MSCRNILRLISLTLEIGRSTAYEVAAIKSMLVYLAEKQSDDKE